MFVWCVCSVSAWTGQLGARTNAAVWCCAYTASPLRHIATAAKQDTRIHMPHAHGVAYSCWFCALCVLPVLLVVFMKRENNHRIPPATRACALYSFVCPKPLRTLGVALSRRWGMPKPRQKVMGNPVEVCCPLPWANKIRRVATPYTLNGCSPSLKDSDSKGQSVPSHFGV